MKQKNISLLIGTNICDAAYITQNGNEHKTAECTQVNTARTFPDVQDADYADFLVKLSASREKVEALMREHFDEDGEPRKKVPAETDTEVATDFDWSLYV